MFGSPTTNYKQFGLKAITNQIENQPANHARSTTNVHRATHADNYAHCVNCDTNCFKTSNANLLRDSFNVLAQQRIPSSCLHRTIAGVQPSYITSPHSSTFPNSLHSASLQCVQFAFDQSSTRFQISQFILKFIRLVSNLVRLAFKLSVTLFHLNT